MWCFALNPVRVLLTDCAGIQAVTYASTAFASVTRSSTACPHGKVCGAGSEREIGNITPVLKVGLGEAQFGVEPATFAKIMKRFFESSSHPCSACQNLPRPVSSQLVTTNTLQVAPQVLILIFGREQVSFADVINCDDLSTLLLLHTLFQTPICCISMRIVSKHQHLSSMMLRCMIVKPVELVDCIEMGKTDRFGKTRLVPHVPTSS